MRTVSLVVRGSARAIQRSVCTTRCGFAMRALGPILQKPDGPIQRLFKQHLDSLPSRYYLELRLKRARLPAERARGARDGNGTVRERSRGLLLEW